jgi:hypothetical protein
MHVLLPHVVGAFEHVRQPPDLPFAVREGQVGKRTNTPENRKSHRLAIELLKLRLAATATGASGDVAGMRDDEPMCMLTVVCVSHAAKNGSQKPE